jgi:hypothetical protein
MSNIDNFFNIKRQMLSIVDDILAESFNGKDDVKVQFPNLLSQVQQKLGWSDKQFRHNDPIIREYIRTHPDWYVALGAFGGIMKASERNKKEAIVEAKKKVKEEINAALDLAVAKKKAELQTSVVQASEDQNDIDAS